MNTIVLFDPGIRSLNRGDEIIMVSAERELDRRGLLNDAYVIHCATHAPAVTWYQNNRRNPNFGLYEQAKYKFICGSNLMWKNMCKPRPTFNVNLFNCFPYHNSILMGVGVGKSEGRTNRYTKALYGKILSKDAVHSVRDETAAEFLRGLGYRAIDTGCPTMWRFTPEFCRDIPKKKSSRVVFTLTDYGKDAQYDQKLIDILQDNYEEVYFWIQGIYDKAYFDTLKHTEGIHVVEPKLEAVSELLSQDDIEYVGTRLHGGMFAMQHKKRTVILAIDNRVRDLGASYALNWLERREIEKLPEMLHRELASDVKLKQNHIEEWFAQFTLKDTRIAGAQSAEQSVAL